MGLQRRLLSSQEWVKMLGLMDMCRMDSVGLENAGDEVAAVARQGKKGEEERRREKVGDEYLSFAIPYL